MMAVIGILRGIRICGTSSKSIARIRDTLKTRSVTFTPHIRIDVFNPNRIAVGTRISAMNFDLLFATSVSAVGVLRTLAFCGYRSLTHHFVVGRWCASCSQLHFRGSSTSVLHHPRANIRRASARLQGCSYMSHYTRNRNCFMLRPLFRGGKSKGSHYWQALVLSSRSELRAALTRADRCEWGAA